MLPNVHAIAWTTDPEFDFNAVERRLQGSPALVSRIGAPTVTIERRSDTSPTNLWAYLLKNAAVAKRRVPSRRTLSGLELADCELRAASAARQHEILSQIYFSELIFAGGDDEPIREHLDSEIARYAPPRRGEQRPESAAVFWNRVRRQHGRDEHFYPVAIDRSRAQLPVDSPVSLAGTRFYKDR